MKSFLAAHSPGQRASVVEDPPSSGVEAAVEALLR